MLQPEHSEIKETNESPKIIPVVGSKATNLELTDNLQQERDEMTDFFDTLNPNDIQRGNTHLETTKDEKGSYINIKGNKFYNLDSIQEKEEFSGYGYIDEEGLLILAWFNQGKMAFPCLKVSQDERKRIFNPREISIIDFLGNIKRNDIIHDPVDNDDGESYNYPKTAKDKKGSYIDINNIKCYDLESVKKITGYGYINKDGGLIISRLEKGEVTFPCLYISPNMKKRIFPEENSEENKNDI